MGYSNTAHFFLSFWFSPLCIFSLSKFLRKSVLKLRGSLQQSSVHLQCHAFNSYGHTSKVGRNVNVYASVNDDGDVEDNIADYDDDGNDNDEHAFRTCSKVGWKIR